MMLSANDLFEFRIGSRCCKIALVLILVMTVITSWINIGITQAQETQVGATDDSSQKTILTTASGKPYGVGQVEMPLSLAIAKGWHSDQSIEVVSTDCKIWLTTCAIVANAEPTASVERNESDSKNELLRIHFLYSGNDPSEVEIHIAGKPSLTIRSSDSDVPHSELMQELMQRWWKALRNQQSGTPLAIRELADDFLLAIAKHLGMAHTPRRALQNDDSSQLEKQFERTLGMLLGFESVRLAMMIDDNAATVGLGPAIHPLPSAVNVVGQRIPPSAQLSKEVEPIASLVPNDCFYLRCGSISNYMWLRRFLIGWGGSLDEIVTNTTLDTDVRSRIENQLGINSKAWRLAESSVSDMAVIGSDVFFSEGAGIAILLEAQPGEELKLEAIIQQQRIEKAKLLEAIRHSETVANHSVSLFRTTDNRMRSFFVRHGRYLLVTNSHAILSSIISPQATAHSLANLQEYRYAVASNPSAKAGITIYLSDPFIRRLASPAFRIELGRRRASAMECRQLEVAALIAKALGKRSDSKPSLVAENFLSKDFGIRPDGSHVELQSNGAFDTMRGKAGTFIPVADVAATKANQAELAAYYSFSERYKAEWPAMDPVLMTIASTTMDDTVDRVELKIHITPYARNEYSFLTRYLSQPSTVHSRLSQNELMGVSARLRSQSRDLLAHIGIRDTIVPFRIQQGELLRTDDSSQEFATQQSFAAVSPPGMDGLQAISGLMQSLQNRKVEVPPSTRPASTVQGLLDFNPFRTGRILSSPELLIVSGEMVLRGLLGATKLNSIYEDDQWSIYGGNKQLRQEVRDSLVAQELDEPSQLLLRVGEVNQSQVAPYLNAYSFCQSRKQSAAMASWLNAWSIGLQTDRKDFRKNVEHALQGELKCPLGGEFKLTGQPAVWTSNKWEQNSLAMVDHVPADYRFPFIQWLKRVELKFNLASASLNSDVILQVARANDNVASPLELRPLPNGHILKPAATVPPPAIASTSVEDTGSAPTLTLRLSTKMLQGLTNATYSSSGDQVLLGGFGRTANLVDARNLKGLQVLRGHQNTIWTVALSPDGKTAVTGSEDKTLRIWNTTTGQELKRFNADGIFSCVRFSPEGNSVFATNWDGKVRIIEIPSFKVKTVIDCGQPTLDIAIFEDRMRFVVGTPSGEIVLYDSLTKRVLKRFFGHTATVHSVALFHDGTHFLSASHDHTLRLWNVETGTTTTVYRGHTAPVHEVRLAPNDRQFVSCSADGTVRFWDVKSDSPRVSSVSGSEVRGISFSPDGKSIAAVSMDGKLRMLQLEHAN